MVDINAEVAELELNQHVDEVQKKYNVSSQTMNFILAGLAQQYAIKAIAMLELNKDDA